MINLDYIKHLYSEGILEDYAEHLIFWAANDYQCEVYSRGKYLEKDLARRHIEKTLISPYFDIKTCLAWVSDLMQNPNLSMYEKSLCIKKRKYFSALRRIYRSRNIYNILRSINWHIIKIDDNEKWDQFVSFINGNTNEPPKNTRPSTGFKKNKVSSKIIYNRNGKKY